MRLCMPLASHATRSRQQHIAQSQRNNGNDNIYTLSQIQSELAEADASIGELQRHTQTENQPTNEHTNELTAVASR